MMNPFFADVGVPMLFLEWPAMALALAPVVLIEFWVVRTMIRISYKKALIGVAVANLISTGVGIPIAWAVLVGGEMGLGAAFYKLSSPYSETMFTGPHPPMALQKLIFVAMQAPWLAPYDSQLYWMIPLAAILLLVPFLAVSYWIESRICEWWWKKEKIEKAAARKAMWRANVASYGFLFLLALGYLIYSCGHPESY